MLENVTNQVLKKKKRYHEDILKNRSLTVGDLVWRWYPPWSKQKLGLGWRGPYKGTRKLAHLHTRYSIVKKNASVVVHVDHLYPYITEDLESEHDTSWQTHDENMIMKHTGKPYKIQMYKIPQLTRCGRLIKPPNRFSPKFSYAHTDHYKISLSFHQIHLTNSSQDLLYMYLNKKNHHLYNVYVHRVANA